MMAIVMTEDAFSCNIILILTDQVVSALSNNLDWGN